MTDKGDKREPTEEQIDGVRRVKRKLYAKLYDKFEAQENYRRLVQGAHVEAKRKEGKRR